MRRMINRAPLVNHAESGDPKPEIRKVPRKGSEHPLVNQQLPQRRRAKDQEAAALTKLAKSPPSGRIGQDGRIRTGKSGTRKTGSGTKRSRRSQFPSQ